MSLKDHTHEPILGGLSLESSLGSPDSCTESADSNVDPPVGM